MPEREIADKHDLFALPLQAKVKVGWRACIVSFPATKA
jgi:hypothetical protein